MIMTNQAVILAARKEKTSEIPFPLLEFEQGECLISRTLSLLNDIGIKKIVLVIGYKAELFERFKDDNVQLIVSDNYEFSASMSSLAAAKELISEDFILVEGDTFFEKTVLEQLASLHEGNCLAVTEESGSGDECYVESQSGFITKISKDKHRICNFEGELLGISRISFSTYKSMIKLWESSTNSLLNYEYVFMDVTSLKDRPFVFFKNLIWGDVDCLYDYRRLKKTVYRTLKQKEEQFDRRKLLSYLSELINNEDLSSVEIVRIGGMSNKNFRINFKGNSFVLRIPGPGSKEMIDRNNEEINAEIGSIIGVNPKVKFFNRDNGVKLTEYIDNAETLNAATIQRHDNLLKVIDIYKRIHHSKKRLNNVFNLFEEIEKYDNLIESLGANMFDGWKSFKPQVLELKSLLYRMGIESCPCHNDAVADNFIKSGDGHLYLIDWEYSGMNDPVADIAALFLENSFSDDSISFFLSNYYSDDIPSNINKKILCFQILWDTLWAQWSIIKEANGDSLGSYGKDRFNRAINSISLIDKL